MKRAVLDTNVIISALANYTGVPGKIYDGLRSGRFELVSSVFILQEFWRISIEKLHYRPEEIVPILSILVSSAIMVEPRKIFLKDIQENDLPIIGTALAGQVDFLVTGDKAMLKLKQFQGIKIVSPKDFLKWL